MNLGMQVLPNIMKAKRKPIEEIDVNSLKY